MLLLPMRTALRRQAYFGEDIDAQRNFRKRRQDAMVFPLAPAAIYLLSAQAMRESEAVLKH